MMVANNPHQALTALAIDVVASDDEIRQRVRRLVVALLADAEHTVKFGSPFDRAMLMRSVVPSLLRAMQNADADAKDIEMRAAYGRMMAELRGDVDE